MNCETCNGKGYIHTAVYHHPTIPDGTDIEALEKKGVIIDL